MPVTIHPPATARDAADIVVDQGADWKVGAMGSLQVVNATTVVVAEFASGQWGWVEKS